MYLYSLNTKKNEILKHDDSEYVKTHHKLHSIVVVFLQVTGLSLTPGDDQLLVVHLQHNDLVICLCSQSKANRVTECMATIYLQIYQ